MVIAVEAAAVEAAAEEEVEEDGVTDADNDAGTLEVVARVELIEKEGLLVASTLDDNDDGVAERDEEFVCVGIEEVVDEVLATKADVPDGDCDEDRAEVEVMTLGTLESTSDVEDGREDGPALEIDAVVRTLLILEELEGPRVEVEIDNVGTLDLDSEAITDDDKSPDFECEVSGVGEETGVVGTTRRVDVALDERERLALVRTVAEVLDRTGVVTPVLVVDADTAAASFVVILASKELTHAQKLLETAAGLYPISPPPGILIMAAPARSGEASTHSTTRSVVVLIVIVPEACYTNRGEDVRSGGKSRRRKRDVIAVAGQTNVQRAEMRVLGKDIVAGKCDLSMRMKVCQPDP